MGIVMKDTEIRTRKERVEEIIQTLEDGDVSIERAVELREEAQELLTELEEQLDVGDGSVSIVNEPDN